METIARTKTSRTEANADTDMPPEANEFKQIVHQIIPLLGTANRWVTCRRCGGSTWTRPCGRTRLSSGRSGSRAAADAVRDGAALRSRSECPGDTLALRTDLVLGTLIQCFDWDRVNGVEVDMTEGGGLTIPMTVPLEAMCMALFRCSDATCWKVLQW
ncbi:hypothetical protein HU200_029559 [Digitaria exilis]|uniref:Uncharacterized protein n=1 Tax=Digitaria exilis TaxID=1010633 RepID=A0A835BPT9_9POAL|nr:hypothetical protein HU200_029559 [Digitaria exilis]